MKRILILDLSPDGHHPRYIRWILESDVCRRAAVILASRREMFHHAILKNSLDSVSCHLVKPSSDEEIVLRDLFSTHALIRRQFILWRIWRRVFIDANAQSRVDVVIMVNADDCLDAIGVLGSPFGLVPWMGILMTPNFHFHRMGVQAPKPRFPAFRERLLRRALRGRSLAALMTIDPTLYAFAASHLSSKEREKLRFLPDPAPDLQLGRAEDAKAALGIPRDSKVVLAYGTLTARKGLIPLLQSASSPECPSNIHVLLAGEPSDEISAFLQEERVASLLRQNRLTVISGYVLDAEAGLYLAAADCMWVGYQGFYLMSAVLVLAARHGVPCIVSDFGIAGYLVREHQLGLSIDPNDIQSILAALQRVSQDRGELAVQSLRGVATFSRNSVPDFQTSISALVSSIVPNSQS